MDPPPTPMHTHMHIHTEHHRNKVKTSGPARNLGSQRRPTPRDCDPGSACPTLATTTCPPSCPTATWPSSPLSCGNSQKSVSLYISYVVAHSPVELRIVCLLKNQRLLLLNTDRHCCVLARAFPPCSSPSFLFVSLRPVDRRLGREEDVVAHLLQLRHVRLALPFCPHARTHARTRKHTHEHARSHAHTCARAHRHTVSHTHTHKHTHTHTHKQG